MSNPYLAEIRCFSFNFAPKGWAVCNGQLLPINQNQALFALLGTNYGGNGTTNFALPNLQGQAPGHFGNGFTQGSTTGSINVTLAGTGMPSHTHSIVSEIVEPGGATEHSASPSASAMIGPSNPDGLYNTVQQTQVSFSAGALSSAGGSQPHPNMQPYLVLSFCIALQGIFPSRS